MKTMSILAAMQNRSIGLRHFAGIGVVALGLSALAPTMAEAAFVSDKACEAATESCGGNPETDYYTWTNRSPAAGQSFDVLWALDLSTDNGLVELRARSTWTIFSFTQVPNGGSDTLVLDVDIENTTDLSDFPGSNAAILAFAFGITPDADLTAFQNVVGPFSSADNTGPGVNFPAYNIVDVCVWSANNCSGGNVNQGLQAGQSDDDILLTLMADDFRTFVLGPIAIKWQTAFGSFQIAGYPDELPDPPSPPAVDVPVPGAIPLVGAGLVILGFAVKRSRRECA
jgi:hypothetical protein